MGSATTSTPKPHRKHGWWLACVVCAGFASSPLGAQTEVDGGANSVAAAAAEETAAASTAPDDASDVSAAEADPIATNEQLVASMIAQFGRKSLQTAEAYLDLADAQRQAKQHEQAAESYLAAVEVYRAVDGPFTALAIAPLKNLGDNYHEAEDDVNAVASYSEARTVSRRAYGLHNQEQIELLDRLSVSLLDMNQLAEAEAQQIEALRLVQRGNAPDSDEVLDAIYKYAEWLGERQLFQLERDQFMRALRIIRSSRGDKDIRQVRALIGIGNTYREERNPASAGISSLQEALALLLEQPEHDPVAIAGALRDIGDWSVAFGKAGYNGTEYQRSWQLLGSAPGGERLRRDWYSGANYVLYEPISPRGLSTEPDALSGHVTISFDIDTAGNSTNVMLVESEPVGFKDEAILRHIRRSRFRPLIADGQLIAGRNLAIQVRFRYMPESASDDDDD